MDDTGSGSARPAEGIDRFAWHPRWAGKTVAEVRTALRAEAQRDQRAYALALDAAEEHENDALASVLALEETWSPLTLDWAETDPDALADAMLGAELERERRRQLVPLDELRSMARPPSAIPAGVPEKAVRLTDPARRWVVLLVALALVLLLIWRLLAG